MNETNTGQQKITAKTVKQVRLINTDERPDAALIAFTTGNGSVEHFVLPKSAMNDLAEKMIKFGGGSN